jgi:muconolactone delta-isomerase
MQFLVLARRLTENFTEEQFAAVLDLEAERVRELYTEGKLRSVWSREDVLGACLLFECANVAEVESLMQSLPLAAKGMLETQIIGLRGYRGFAPLGIT